MGGGKGKGDKGDKGKGKKGKWRPREKGSWPDLKKIRKGLKHQMKKAADNLEAARAAGNDNEIFLCEHRASWTQRKQELLDIGHVMVWDMPFVHNGIQLDYGSLDDEAKRGLTEKEIQWNAELRSWSAEHHQAQITGSGAPGTALCSKSAVLCSWNACSQKACSRSTQVPAAVPTRESHCSPAPWWLLPAAGWLLPSLGRRKHAYTVQGQRARKHKGKHRLP